MNKFIKTLIIVVIALVLLAFVYPQGINKSIDWINAKISLKISHVYNKSFHLGLDLLGGTHLLYQADLSKIDAPGKSDAMQGIRDVIERRVNFFGVAEPLVQISGQDRLVVELAGIKDDRSSS